MKGMWLGGAACPPWLTLHLRLRGGPPPEAEGVGWVACRAVARAPWPAFARGLRRGSLARFASVGWWGRKDSNLRSHKTADLQSAPFATRDTSPLNSIATHPLKGGNKAMDDAET